MLVCGYLCLIVLFAWLFAALAVDGCALGLLTCFDCRFEIVCCCLLILGFGVLGWSFDAWFDLGEFIGLGFEWILLTGSGFSVLGNLVV